MQSEIFPSDVLPFSAPALRGRQRRIPVQRSASLNSRELDQLRSVLRIPSDMEPDDIEAARWRHIINTLFHQFPLWLLADDVTSIYLRIESPDQMERIQ